MSKVVTFSVVTVVTVVTVVNHGNCNTVVTVTATVTVAVAVPVIVAVAVAPVVTEREPQPQLSAHLDTLRHTKTDLRDVRLLANDVGEREALRLLLHIAAHLAQPQPSDGRSPGAATARI